MRYKIFKGDTLINTIEADESFCKKYCASNGYRYEESAANKPEIKPTAADQMRADIDYIAVMTGVAL